MNQKVKPLPRHLRKKVLRLAVHAVLWSLAAYAFWPVVRWLAVDAVFWPPVPEACRMAVAGSTETEPKGGACWPVVWDTLQILLVGRFPAAEMWRLGVAALLGGAALVVAFRRQRILTPLLFLIAAAVCVTGAPWLGLAHVPASEWGGLTLTLMLSIAGLAGGFALGLALAVARKSRLPVARWLAIAYTETLRGVPLITVLFFAMYVLPLFLPRDWGSLSEVGRAAVAIILFEAAYLAEVIRAGLAAVDRGQDEAAKALGLSKLLRLRLIILPQALKHAAPALVSTGIGLIKDTSLVAIIGLFDLLGMARNVPSIPRWIGRDLEPLIFAGCVYLVLSLVLERAATHFELRRQPVPRAARRLPMATSTGEGH